MIAHQRRHQRRRQPQRAGSAKDIEAVGSHCGFDRRVLAAPFRDEPVEPDRIDDGAGEDVRADFGSLFHDNNRLFRRQLFEPDRGGKPGRPRTDDHDVKLHRFTRRKVRCIHESNFAPNYGPNFKPGTPMADCSRISRADNRCAPAKPARRRSLLEFAA